MLKSIPAKPANQSEKSLADLKAITDGLGLGSAFVNGVMKIDIGAVYNVTDYIDGVKLLNRLGYAA